MDRERVLATYDEQIRRDTTPPVASWVVEDRGHVLRATAPSGGRAGAFIQWSDLGGLPAAEVDAVIAEQVAYFVELGRHSEWKHFDYDEPTDLSDRLVAAGLTREDPEALVVGDVAGVLAACRSSRPAEGVRVRLASEADLPEIARLHEAVWDEDWSWLADELRTEMTERPDDLIIFVAEDEDSGRQMSSAWVRFQPGTDFAGLWGGSTHPDFRRRGAYRALVQVRAELAAERGVPYLQVDASPDSEPILARLGLVRLATTTPHTWAPARPAAT